MAITPPPIAPIKAPRKARLPSVKPSVAPQKKPSVKARKSLSGTGFNLPKIRSVDFERNKYGSFEVWHVPPGTVYRKDKTYLGYVGKKLLEVWEGLPDAGRQKAVEDWIAEKRAKKGIDTN
jgi:hypothetical protein